MRRTGERMFALGRESKLAGEPSHSPLSHIPVLRGTYASLLQTKLCRAQ